jgi:2-oxoisovalerate dehydrogenase E2 component (dihydrolipoyl transacylase)
MSEHVIKMPDIGEGIAEVELTAWHVKPGDRVVEDQALADVMTDKANVEIPSPVVGKVISLGGEVGKLMAVGAELIRIEVEGEGTAEPRRVGFSPPAPSSRPADGGLKPTLQEPKRLAAPVNGDRPIASPAVRRRAWELGIELRDVKPSGLGGRIMQADLETHATRMPARAPQVAREIAPPQPRPQEETQAIPVIGLRRKIAQKMQESKRRIPHFSYVEEVDVTDVEALRAQLNERYKGLRPRLTLLPFLIRAIVLAAAEHPVVNARFDDEAGVVTRHRAVHVGIATQTDAGLLVPVLRDAQVRSLWDCATEVARLAENARAGRATRDELSGSTITLTSLGALGGIASTPVINHPEVAIVGVNRIVERPVMRKGAVVGRQMMNLSSSFDHRVVDGQHAALFVQALRRLLESPAMLFVD